MKKRYKILYFVSMMQPIGRRSLSQSLGISERILRSEVDFLKQQGLIEVDNLGMKLSQDGVEVLHKVSPYIRKLFGLNDLENELQNKLQLKKVIVVAGDVDTDPFVKKELGRAAAHLMRQYMKEKDIVALTGGSTIAEVAEMMPEHPHLHSVLFVPARGGIGENHEYLANTLVSIMAKKTGGSYRLLHVPDQLSEETYHFLINEEHVQEVLAVIRSARIVVHGIGQAKIMGIRRRMPAEIMQLLEDKKAVGEAFGYYFDQDGNIVYKMNTIGLTLDDLVHIPHIIAVAGGKSKALAILSVLRHNIKQMLVTDEGAAREILNHL
ncbi:sugar-binding transcriptional regulator [Tepidibacillus sp. LV47]|uniref:sugar-binding transcriptional regulator n=1 Tax=Tepidibacillus sp. LV47 TaxID=3398228 RepID=UPI003AAC2C09